MRASACVASITAARPPTVPPLAVVLLHGAGADASQWIDIGLRDAVDAVSARHPTALVAVAPDLDASSPVSMLLEGLLPAIELRFRPHSAFAISGISRRRAGVRDRRRHTVEVRVARSAQSRRLRLGRHRRVARGRDDRRRRPRPPRTIGAPARRRFREVGRCRHRTLATRRAQPPVLASTPPQLPRVPPERPRDSVMTLLLATPSSSSGNT